MTSPLPLDSKIPDLRIIPLGRLLPHELHDRQRARPLIERLRQDGVLRNPPIVTPLGPHDDRFVILDGANRTVALDVLGIGHVLVQVVPYEPPQVELYTWYHVLSGIEADELQRQFQGLAGLDTLQSDIFHARAALARKTILAYYLLANGQVYMLAGGLDLHKRTQLLCQIVDSYIGIAHVNRVNTDHVDQLLTMYPALSAAVIFPSYEPVEILDLAQSGLRVPAGITRHVIHGRALRLNYPLEKLSAAAPLEVKNQELLNWIHSRFEQRGVRYYAESTYLFDE